MSNIEGALRPRLSEAPCPIWGLVRGNGEQKRRGTPGYQEPRPRPEPNAWLSLRSAAARQDPYDDHNGIRNPSGRIHEFLPRHQDNVDAIDETGNPDIRVPKEIKSEDGLRAGDAPEGEDA
ncbi:hypothetical protein NDU88_003155 [Pleurodeles waltl]|uniref:Uncharacterized protein n=1 Tax=Pleurodeles waltl TaxID=8319 RepID=A0AAV7T3Z5_PLEWA|nr:hypothetical protein NDU88_003155 [Pleurodeles waltl]